MKSLKKNFEFKVILILSLIFVIVLLLGYGAYSKLTTIVNDFSEISSTDQRLEINNNLKINLTEIENIAKTHSLTEDQRYINVYNTKTAVIKQELEKLQEINAKAKLKIDVHKLDSLINDKLVILDGIMYSQDPFRVQAALEKVILNIRKSEQGGKDKKISKITVADIEASKLQMQNWLAYGNRSDLLNQLRKQGEAARKIEYQRIQNQFATEWDAFSKSSDDKTKRQRRVEFRLWKRALKDSIEIILNNTKNSNQAIDLNKILEEKESIDSDEENEFDDSDNLTENTSKSILDAKSGIDFNFLNKEINAVRKEEFVIEQQIKFAELQMITLDNELSVEIEHFFEDFVRLKKIELSKTANTVGKDSTKVNGQIALVTIAVGILILFLVFLITNYVRKNNIYRIALKKSQLEAENSSRSREKFFANMSHEIRTPMNAIVGFSDQLAESDLDDQQQSYIDMIQKSSEHLVYLINDVLDFSKLQSGKLKLESAAFNIHDVAKEVTSFSKQLAIEKNINVSLKIDKSVPEFIVGDSFRLRQILLNLMSNAIKFTEIGKVDMLINYSKINSTDKLNVQIIDTGAGMDNETLSRIFNEFEQASSATAKNHGGSGLGLSIAKMLVELMQGEIHLTSEFNKGTTAMVLVPTSKSSKENVVVQPNLRIVSNLRKVLIVDDEQFNRQLLASIFTKNGILFDEAEDGVQAIEKLHKSNFDLILMDARMPNLNGVEATKEIRNLIDPIKRTTKIIVLTAAISENESTEFREAGMDGYVSKPFKEQDLFKEINRVLENTTRIGQSRKATVKSEKNLQSFNFSHLKEMSGNDKGFYIEMLQTFITSTKNGVATIKIGLENDDWELIANEAHKISSPCKHIGAHKLYDLLNRIENITRTRKSTKRIKTAFKGLEDESIIVLKAVNDELSLTNK